MDILVYADWAGMEEPALMGTLSVIHTKGREVFSFAYNKAWLPHPQAQNLDPDLQLYEGPQYLSGDKPNFGLFLDSSPDRWGRVLMDRRESILAKAENRKPKKLFEEDYLLGVYDAHRMGALRFRLTPEGNFLHDNRKLSAPPWTSVRELEFASLQLEKNEGGELEQSQWIHLLLAPGASLGGARPKASVTGPDDRLWIAKFPSVKDKTDIGAWEMVAAELAAAAGLQVPPAMLRKFNSDHHTFLSSRFDRMKENRRLHFASAMTLLGKSDGDGGSYLELAEFIIKNGSHTGADLQELWKRIVFNIAIKNTDDHLRNHGFLLSPGGGWRLSPAYDVNPVWFGTGLTLNINETDNALDFDLALSVAPYFRVSKTDALVQMKLIQEVVATWSQLAKKYGIAAREQDIMAGAFEL